jgi:asparagine synthase (glutamine-hydrolysing)
MFARLRGEFAFAIVDQPRRELILARDRMGLKPLFYAQGKGRFLFASEIKALFCVDDVERRFAPEGLLAAMTLADVPGTTLFEGVRQVRHGHYLRVRLDTLEATEHRYWDAWAARRTDIPRERCEQTELVRVTVTKAVELRLRADAPVGAFLSGGLDSSIVTVLAARRLGRIDGFALAFEDSPRHNEFAFAQAVAANHSEIALHRIPITHAAMVRKLEETVWRLERPFGNLHGIAKIIQSQYARQHVAAVLTGDGGDECFCGYSTHWLQHALQSANYQRSAIQDALQAMRREARTIGGNRYYLTGGLARKSGPSVQLLVDRLGFPPCDLATALDAERQIGRLLVPDFARRIDCSPVERLAGQLAETMPAVEHESHAALLQYVQLNSSVPGYIATIADRAEWAGSVEGRAPLFDHRVVELALGLPIEVKLAGTREKHILREAFRDLLPASVVERRKQAFLAPPAPFSSPAGRALLQEYLNTTAIKDAGIWEPKKVLALRAARRCLPNLPVLNLVLTILLTTQILHRQFIRRQW